MAHEVQPPDWIDAETVRSDSSLWEKILTEKAHLLIDLSKVRFIDSTGVGLLIRLQKRVSAQDRRLILVAPGPAVQRALRAMRLWDFFLTAPDHATARNTLEKLADLAPAAILSDPVSEVPSLAWQGEVTAANADSVWKATEDFIRGYAKPTGSLHLHLGQVTFIDSTGLGLMVRARKLAVQHEARLRFLEPASSVRNVIKLSRLDSYLLD